MNYEIKDMKGFCNTIGKTIASEVGLKTKELKNYIKMSNVKEITKEYCECVGGKYFLEEDNVDEIYEDIRNWVIGIDLAKLAAEDKLECYWDDDINQMVFQAKRSKDED
jgi:hypothetical protein